MIRTGPIDPRTIAELFEAARQSYLMRDYDDERESEKYWTAVRELHWRANHDVFLQARSLLISSNKEDRVLAADILAQVHVGNTDLRKLAADALVEAFHVEKEPEVLGAMGVAFGHIDDERAVSLFAPLANDPDGGVRIGVVAALTGHTSTEAIATMICLTRDPDVDVRDWATFGLGSQCEVDTPQLRRALYDRLDDIDSETRGEALVGLARRKNEGIVDLILERLEADDIDYCLLEAAEEFADPRFCRALCKALHNLELADDPDEERYWRRLISEATAACCGKDEFIR